MIEINLNFNQYLELEKLGTGVLSVKLYDKKEFECCSHMNFKKNLSVANNSR